MRRVASRLLPQRLRLRLWLLRSWFTRESFLLRRARPTLRRRVLADVELRRRVRQLSVTGRRFGLARLPPVTVINLASRPDRLEAFQLEARRLGIDRVDRFDAIADANGVLGCASSHASCLRRLVDSPHDALLICEDDVVFLVDRPQLDVLVDAFLDDQAADVACLAYFAARTQPHDRLFLRGAYIRTAACYVVKARIAQELLELWERGIEELRAGADPSRYACDKTWMPLQQRRTFLIPIKRAARQAAGYSDIQRRFVRYTH